MTTPFLALLPCGALLVNLLLFSPALARQLHPRTHAFLVLAVSAFFGASLFALVARVLGWSSLGTTTEIAAFAAGILGFAFIAGWTGSRFASRRHRRENIA